MCYTFDMNKKLRRIIAIIALVFMAIFSVSLVAYFVDRTLLSGMIGIITLFSGGIGLALFLVVWMSRDKDGGENGEPGDKPLGNSDADDKNATTDNEVEDKSVSVPEKTDNDETNPR